MEIRCGDVIHFSKKDYLVGVILADKHEWGFIRHGYRYVKKIYKPGFDFVIFKKYIIPTLKDYFMDLNKKSHLKEQILNILN